MSEFKFIPPGADPNRWRTGADKLEIAYQLKRIADILEGATSSPNKALNGMLQVFSINESVREGQ